MTGFRVLVVDDEPLARGMVGAIVQADPDVAAVVECGDARRVLALIAEHRSEERRVGKECNGQCRSRWSPYH